MEVDVNKPVENPVLKGLLEEIAKAEKVAAPEIAEKIAAELAENAVLLAVMVLDPANMEKQSDGTAVIKKDTKISFSMLTAPDGVAYLPVYTDWTELGKAEAYKGMHVQTLLVRFDDMVSICHGEAGIVINPFSHNFVLTPQHVAHMKQHKDILTQGYSEQVVQKPTKVQLGEPAEYPITMTEAISEYARTNKAIDAIWLKLMLKDGQKSYLLVVDFKGDHREIFSAIAEAAKPHLKNGMYVDMVPYAEDFGQQAATGEPFYRRKKGLFGR